VFVRAGDGCRRAVGRHPNAQDRSDHHDGEQSFEQTARLLERWLATQAQAGGSELVRVGLLRGYADTGGCNKLK